MIGNGDLSTSDDLVNENQVIHDTARQCTDRDLIGTGVDVGSDSLFLQPPCLGQKGSHIPRGSVCAKTADNRCDAA